MFNLLEIDSDIAIWLVLDEKEYQLSQFRIGFGQSADYKGQPQNEVRGGRMLLSLPQTLPDNIYRWAMTSSKKDGKIVLKSKIANAPLRIEFKNGYCINFERSINIKAGINTELLISPEEIVINGFDFHNHWIK